MRTIYFEKNIPKVLLAKALRPVWPGVVFSPLSPTRFDDVAEVPLPDPGWVRVRNRLCGICASDLHLLLAEADPKVAPAALPGTERMYLGHELVGEVTEVGAEVAGLTDLPVVVLNSHSHYDHIGGNHQFDFIYGPDHPYTRSRMKGLDHEAVEEAVSPGWIWKPLPDGFDPASFANPGYEIDEFVDEGSRIDLGGRTLEVLLTPGHAPDSLCLLDREQGLLFTGDTFYPAPLYTHIPGSSFEDYQASARRLAAMAPLVRHILPGHNQGLLGGEYLIRMAEAFDQVAAGEGDFVPTMERPLRVLSTETPHTSFLKVSEGCDHTCAFCAIPLMRGLHRSHPVEALVREAAGLGDQLSLLYQSSTETGSIAVINYSNVRGGGLEGMVDPNYISVDTDCSLIWNSETNIDAEAEFAWFDSEGDVDLWDFHLKSVSGRWDPSIQDWVTDEIYSPCIDTGDPNSAWDEEIAVIGDRFCPSTVRPTCGGGPPG